MVAKRWPFLETRSPRSVVSSSCGSPNDSTSPVSVEALMPEALAAKTRGVPNGQYMAPVGKDAEHKSRARNLKRVT